MEKSFVGSGVRWRWIRVVRDVTLSRSSGLAHKPLLLAAHVRLRILFIFRAQNRITPFVVSYANIIRVAADGHHRSFIQSLQIIYNTLSPLYPSCARTVEKRHAAGKWIRFVYRQKRYRYGNGGGSIGRGNESKRRGPDRSVFDNAHTIY